MVDFGKLPQFAQRQTAFLAQTLKQQPKCGLSHYTSY
jgi:hypothetical protein